LLATGGGLFVVFMLVLACGFFVAAEYSLVTIRRTRVEQLLAEGRLGARAVADAVANLDSYLATCQIGITMSSLSLGFVGEPALADLFEPLTGRIGGHALALGLSFVFVTALEVIAGELAPRGVALQYPERLALVLATPLRALRVVLRPLVWVLNESGWLLLRLVGVPRNIGAHASIGAEELRLVVQASAQAGAIEMGEQFLLERVLKFGDLTVAGIMVPRTELVALPEDTSTAEAIAAVAEHHFSRYPVYRKDMDDVIGVLHVRDLLVAPPASTLTGLLREPLVVPSQVSVERLLTEMRARRNHFAIAVDEFGGTDGIVTLEDVLEAIVGEMADEFEQPPPVPSPRLGGHIRIDGMESVDALPELLGVTAEPGQYHTVAGYLLDRIGRIPEVGESVDLGDYRLTVVEMDGLRIATVEAVPASGAPAPP
jgi:CBS domain containing-hemolysin-like protein